MTTREDREAAACAVHDVAECVGLPRSVRAWVDSGEDQYGHHHVLERVAALLATHTAAAVERAVAEERDAWRKAEAVVTTTLATALRLTYTSPEAYERVSDDVRHAVVMARRALDDASARSRPPRAAVERGRREGLEAAQAVGDIRTRGEQERIAAAVEQEKERAASTCEAMAAGIEALSMSASVGEALRWAAEIIRAGEVVTGGSARSLPRPPRAGAGQDEATLSQWTEGTIAGSTATAEDIIATLRADAERFRDRAAECDGQEAYDLCVRASTLDDAADDIAKGPRRYYQDASGEAGEVGRG